MNDLQRFNYSILKVVPDPLRDESINLGVIVIDEKNGLGRAEFQRFTRPLRSRITGLLPGVDVGAIEDGVESCRSQIGVETQLAFVDSKEDRISSAAQLEALSSELLNQLQLTRPLTYRGDSLQAVTDELYALFVSPRRRPPVHDAHMTTKRLRTLIRRVVQKWGTESLRIDERRLERAGAASHFADFWVESGSPLAALVAIPDDPGEKFEAWARRDSIPTIAAEFTRLNPTFCAVAVFPPNGIAPPAPFVQETMDFLKAYEHVLVLRADQLEAHRSQIAPSLL